MDRSLAELGLKVGQHVTVRGPPEARAFKPYTDEEDRDADLQAKIDLLGIASGKIPFRRGNLSPVGTWGADLTRAKMALASAGASLMDALRAGDDKLLGVEELKAQIEVTSAALNEKETAAHDTSPEVPFPGGLTVFYHKPEKWGDADRHVMEVALKKQYGRGPLVCACGVDGDARAIRGPVIDSVCRSCYNGTLAVIAGPTPFPSSHGEHDPINPPRTIRLPQSAVAARDHSIDRLINQSSFRYMRPGGVGATIG